MTDKHRRLIVVVVVVVLILAVITLLLPWLRRYLLTQVVPGIEEEEQRFEKRLKLTIPHDTQPGEYELRVSWEDPQEGRLLTLSDPVTIVVSSNGDDVGGGGDGGGNGSGNGGGSGDSGANELSAPVRTFAFSPDRGHRVYGAYSGIRSDKGLSVVTLAHARAGLEKKVSVSRGDYWLYINAKHDRPGPVDVAVYLNNRAWKVVRLDKNDDRYRTHRIGLLRQFSGGVIRFRFLNDIYDKSDPTNEAKDRNLHIASWGLTTDPSRLPVAKTSRAVGGGRSQGWEVLPRLNQVIREELGSRFVVLDIWRYYAHRLTTKPTNREAIQSEAHLRNVMRYWKNVSPLRPRGE